MVESYRHSRLPSSHLLSSPYISNPASEFSSLIRRNCNPRTKSQISEEEAKMNDELVGRSVDLVSILSSENRDFLVRNNGDQVNVKDLKGKTVGLYFSATWCSPCRSFTPVLSELYQELSSLKGDFEVVFVSLDKDEESHSSYFSEMPWLAIPFKDPTIERLRDEFHNGCIPYLLLIDGDGTVSSTEGVVLIREYGSRAYPFTAERFRQLEEEEELAKLSVPLKSHLVSPSRDYVISNDGKKVPFSEIEGKTVGLYLTIQSDYEPCAEFTEKLAKVYNKLKKKRENFEVVMVYMHDEKEEFEKDFSRMPWLSLPPGDEACNKIQAHFNLTSIPRLIIFGPGGDVQNSDVCELIDEHGAGAYPFTCERLAELAEIKKAKMESQTLESLLVSREIDFVLNKSGSKVPVSALVGKHIMLYFSAHWCPPCRTFTPKLIESYHKIKAKESNFEVIFVPGDFDQASFDGYYKTMPWLTLPFGDERQMFLTRWFKVTGIPTLVAVGPDGRTVTTDARDAVEEYGADAFPFTADHVKGLEVKGNEAPKEGYVCDGGVCLKC